MKQTKTGWIGVENGFSLTGLDEDQGWTSGDSTSSWNNHLINVRCLVRNSTINTEQHHTPNFLKNIFVQMSSV